MKCLISVFVFLRFALVTSLQRSSYPSLPLVKAKMNTLSGGPLIMVRFHFLILFDVQELLTGCVTSSAVVYVSIFCFISVFFLFFLSKVQFLLNF